MKSPAQRFWVTKLTILREHTNLLLLSVDCPPRAAPARSGLCFGSKVLRGNLLCLWDGVQWAAEFGGPGPRVGLPSALPRAEGAVLRELGLAGGSAASSPHLRGMGWRHRPLQRRTPLGSREPPTSLRPGHRPPALSLSSLGNLLFLYPFSDCLSCSRYLPGAKEDEGKS